MVTDQYARKAKRTLKARFQGEKLDQKTQILKGNLKAALEAAIDLGYEKNTIDKIVRATTENEATRALIEARHAMA